MRRPLLVSTLLVLGGLLACNDEQPAPPPHATAPVAPAPTDTAAPQPAAPSGTGTGANKPAPSEPEWVAPVVATTSPGCGTPRPRAVHADYTNAAGRSYHVWGPSSYDPNKTYPVVFTFHGIETNGSDFESWFKMEDYTQNEAFVVYPDATKGYWDVGGDTDLQFFDDMMKDLGETYCLDPSRVLAFGFSWGGHFVDHLGCKRAGYVKAITVGDGGPGGDKQHCGRLPVLVTTRTKDTNEFPAFGLNVQTEWTSLDQCGAAGEQAPQVNPQNGENMGYCVTHAGCKLPGSLVYCEDTSSFGANDPPDWNHTVREYYRGFAYQWFKDLP